MPFRESGDDCCRDPAGLDVRHAALNTAVGQEDPGNPVELVANFDGHWQELPFTDGDGAGEREPVGG
ncbi:hypothetical protein ColLi_06074 [Colletotrichum liriopes]|uniref:Uncharacterized protein n=1 Tax=Colletotrichum liriopes TaxID=708192 RepID=A0AA37GLH6_9PEZI|nr:hypothetical protein ColLi_06074 [Colletotrichum liriopes]